LNLDVIAQQHTSSQSSNDLCHCTSKYPFLFGLNIVYILYYNHFERRPDEKRIGSL
jgi:hypothetical protein